ncbi:MAG: YtfJ family protein [Spirochaetia bacterium]|nr:YtfJ family protein [Spirochaetia bacterium]
MKRLIMLLIISTGLYSNSSFLLKEIYNDENIKYISNNNPFDSRTLSGKNNLIVYADPDKKRDTEKLIDKLIQINVPESKLGKIFIINLAATWLPNIIINSKIKSKQESNPEIIFVKDYQKVLVKEWKLKDDEVNIMLLDENLKILFLKKGNIKDKDISAVIKIAK